ncbi:unnamed protein product, partial [Musa acuminata var. zebrina]
LRSRGAARQKRTGRRGRNLEAKLKTTKLLAAEAKERAGALLAGFASFASVERHGRGIGSRGFRLIFVRFRLVSLILAESSYLVQEEKKPEKEGKKEPPPPLPAAAAEEEKEKKDGGGGDGGEGEKKEGEKKESEKAAENPPPPPPPPPEEVVMKVYMHCEGCARKVRRCLRGFQGVEEVVADSRTHRVVVKGRKAAEDPMKACAQEIKKRILRMKVLVPRARTFSFGFAETGVQTAEPDLKSLEVTVKGAFDPASLVAYVHKRTGKHAAVVKQEPVEKKPEEPEKAKAEEPPPAEAAGKDEKKSSGGEKNEKEKKGGENKEEEKKKEGGGEDSKKDGTVAAEPEQKNGDKKKEEQEEKKEANGGGGGVGQGATEVPAAVVAVAATAIDGGGAGKPKRNEFYYYYPRYPVEYAYPPQIFSDENPNACAVM